MRLTTIPVAAVLYVIFSIAAALAGVAGVIALCFGRTTYLSRICRAMDALLAALLGWDGRSTVSKECGASDCRFCRVLCRVLSALLERDHCARERAGADR
jgi:hypothetical protein